MTTLHLIRHGRASARDADYDRLHELGHEQARLLGASLAAAVQRYDRVFVGPLTRQLDTLATMREAAGSVGAGWPEAVVLEGLAEAPFEPLLKQHMVPRLPSDAKLQAQLENIQAASDADARATAMFELFEYMVALWLRGEVGQGLETAEAFRTRVEAAFEQILASAAAGEQVAVISSFGVIDHLLRGVAGLSPPPEHATMRLANASVSLLRRGATGALEVLFHNRVEHLPEPRLITML